MVSYVKMMSHIHMAVPNVKEMESHVKLVVSHIQVMVVTQVMVSYVKMVMVSYIKEVCLMSSWSCLDGGDTSDGSPNGDSHQSCQGDDHVGSVSHHGGVSDFGVLCGECNLILSTQMKM